MKTVEKNGSKFLYDLTHTTKKNIKIGYLVKHKGVIKEVIDIEIDDENYLIDYQDEILSQDDITEIYIPNDNGFVRVYLELKIIAESEAQTAKGEEK